MRLISAYAIGLIFGLGISISGMANPAKVLNFFDVMGTWDPSLALVMGGALIVTFLGYRWILPKPAPLLENNFQVPANKLIDVKLIAGSAYFGIGWGIAGFCPGGALPALGTGRIDVVLFTSALLGGVFVALGLMKLTRKRALLSDNQPA